MPEENNQKKIFAYNNPKKIERDGLRILATETFIVIAISIISLVALNYAGIFKSNKDYAVVLSPTPTFDITKLEFLSCPISGSICGKSTATKEPIASLKFTKIPRGIKLLSVGSGKLSIINQNDKQIITLLMEERAIKITYEAQGLKLSTSSASIRKDDIIGEFTDKSSSLIFSVQSTVTKQYIKTKAFQDKYLTIDESI